jgi:cyclopropane fatty-acyl-phospholipid synthase-like methyltransferase
VNKPFSQACENNKKPILTVLTEHFAQCKRVLEIGSGTGQHGVYFAKNLSHLAWHTSDAASNHAGINLWIKAEPSPNIKPPIALVIGQNSWPVTPYDGVFSANTAHIMQKYEAKLMMELIVEALPKGGVFCQYGPFNLDGQYSSQSNAEFDIHLKSQGYGGIRDIEDLQYWARGLELFAKVTMPANNLTLVWKKR